ncbi:hypothetical protein [Collimonas sp.]|uniref:hypothetical protein n=1 Tax=Collimonas sp. TaxID=1963772 RepID=UPI002B5A4689|nr:hypothetical protein [Collimonas sp.]HWW05901.1 hypothetical protein [Collimonas sp.]
MRDEFGALEVEFVTDFAMQKPLAADHEHDQLGTIFRYQQTKPLRDLTKNDQIAMVGAAKNTRGRLDVEAGKIETTSTDLVVRFLLQEDPVSNRKRRRPSTGLWRFYMGLSFFKIGFG